MKENKTFLSIIIPVYNVKEYLEHCISSFINSDYENYEIILVDDGSTDGSSLICDSLSEKYPRVQAYHIQNSGPSAARNFGISRANGKYIFFCDSDDFVDSKEFENVMYEVENNPSDLYVLDRCHESSAPDVYFIDSIGLKTKEADIKDIYKYALYIRISAPWKKIFKRELIESFKIEFPVGRILHEDLSFLLEYLKVTDRVYVLGQAMYYHRYAPNSLSKKTQFSQFNDIYSVYYEMVELVKLRGIGEEYLNHSQNRFLAILMGMIVRMKKNGIDDKAIKKEIKINNLDSVFVGIKTEGLKGKIRLFFYKTRLFRLYSLLYF